MAQIGYSFLHNPVHKEIIVNTMWIGSPNEPRFQVWKFLHGSLKYGFCKKYTVQVPFCEDKSVQLLRVAFFQSDFLQNPYFSGNLYYHWLMFVCLFSPWDEDIFKHTYSIFKDSNANLGVIF